MKCIFFLCFKLLNKNVCDACKLIFVVICKCCRFFILCDYCILRFRRLVLSCKNLKF